MPIIFERNKRQVLPRWHDSKSVAERGELGPLSKPDKDNIYNHEILLNKIREWEENKTLPYACDLLGTAIVMDKRKVASEAVTFILSQSSGATNSAKVLASGIKTPTHIPLVPQKDAITVKTDEHPQNKYIHHLRNRLNRYPRNAIAWNDMSLAYATLGLKEQAQKCINIALQLAPSNRYIIRSAARLYEHRGELDHALYILRKADNIRKDPWLIAAEVAISDLQERSSRYAKQGKNILESNKFAPFNVTELASAIGTLEAEHGNNKNARKLFRLSLLEPNENTIAQAEWVSRNLTPFEIETRYLRAKYTYEARAINYYYHNRWDKALTEAWLWFQDQPFSPAGSIFGSYVAGAILEDLPKTIEFVQKGLVSNPDNWLLKNNLTYIYAIFGDIEKAEYLFNTIGPDLNDKRRTGTLLGNKRPYLFQERINY